MLVVIAAFALLCLAPTFIPLASALKHDEKRTAAIVGFTSLTAHIGFWLWAFQLNLELSTELGWYLALSVSLPVAALPVIAALRKRAFGVALGAGLAGVAVPMLVATYFLATNSSWSGWGLCLGVPVIAFLVCKISMRVVAETQEKTDSISNISTVRRA